MSSTSYFDDVFTTDPELRRLEEGWAAFTRTLPVDDERHWALPLHITSHPAYRGYKQHTKTRRTRSDVMDRRIRARIKAQMGVS